MSRDLTPPNPYWQRSDLNNPAAMQRTIDGFYDSGNYDGGKPVCHHSRNADGDVVYYADSDDGTWIHDWRCEVDKNGDLRVLDLAEQGTIYDPDESEYKFRKLLPSEKLYWMVICAVQSYAAKNGLTVPSTVDGKKLTRMSADRNCFYVTSQTGEGRRYVLCRTEHPSRLEVMGTTTGPWDAISDDPARIKALYEAHMAAEKKEKPPTVDKVPSPRKEEKMPIVKLSKEEFTETLWDMYSGHTDGQDYISGHLSEEDSKYATNRLMQWRVTLKPGGLNLDKVFFTERPDVAIRDAEINDTHSLYEGIVERARQFVASTEGRWLSKGPKGPKDPLWKREAATASTPKKFRDTMGKAGLPVMQTLPSPDLHFVENRTADRMLSCSWAVGVLWDDTRTIIRHVEVVDVSEVTLTHVTDYLEKNYVIAAWGHLTENEAATTSYLKTEITKRLQEESMTTLQKDKHLENAYAQGFLKKPAHGMSDEEAKAYAEKLIAGGASLPLAGEIQTLEEPEKVEVRVEDHREGRSFVMNFKVDPSGVESALRKLHKAIEDTKIQETAMTPPPRNDTPIHHGLPMTEKTPMKDKIKNKAKEVGKIVAEETKEATFRAGVDIGFDVAKAAALRAIDAVPLDPGTKAMAHMFVETPLGQAFLQYFVSVVIPNLPIPGVSQEMLSAVGHEARVQATAKAMKEGLMFAYKYMMTPELVSSLQTVQQLGVPQAKLDAMRAEEAAATASTEPTEEDD